VTSTTRYAPDVDAMPHMSRVLLGYCGDLHTGCQSDAPHFVQSEALISSDAEGPGVERRLSQFFPNLRDARASQEVARFVEGAARFLG